MTGAVRGVWATDNLRVLSTRTTAPLSEWREAHEVVGLAAADKRDALWRCVIDLQEVAGGSPINAALAILAALA